MKTNSRGGGGGRRALKKQQDGDGKCSHHLSLNQQGLRRFKVFHRHQVLELLSVLKFKHPGYFGLSRKNYEREPLY